MYERYCPAESAILAAANAKRDCQGECGHIQDASGQGQALWRHYDARPNTAIHRVQHYVPHKKQMYIICGSLHKASPLACLTFSCPTSRRMRKAVQPIQALNPYNNNWTIRACVRSKGPKRSFSRNGSDVSVFSLELIDEQVGFCFSNRSNGQCCVLTLPTPLAGHGN